jgi:membrane-bound inhibitor of C-type lysozyme
VAVLAIILLAGCRDSALEPAPGDRQFDCEGLTVSTQEREGDVVVRLPDRELVLREFVGATGPRYSDGRSTIWFEDGQATLEHDERTYTCRPVS